MSYIRTLANGKYHAEVSKNYASIQSKTFSTQKQPLLAVNCRQCNKICQNFLSDAENVLFFCDLLHSEIVPLKGGATSS